MMTRLAAAERGSERSVVERVERSVACSCGDGADFRAARSCENAVVQRLTRF
jgi:hypothetical protein